MVSKDGEPSVFHALEQIHDLNLEGLSDEEQATQSKIHLSTLKCADLCTMESALVRKDVLGPAALAPKFPHPLSQTPL